MKTLHFSTQFKKDFKRYRNNPVKLSKLNDVFRMLENEQKLPKSLFPHKLHGKYKDCIECHIEDDFLLIWTDGNVIEIVRLGTHQELFGR